MESPFENEAEVQLMKHFLLIALFGLLITAGASAQNYHAINGSSYAGALGVHNNPASIVNTPFRWDMALFGTQLKSSTNLFTIYNYSFLSSPANSLYYLSTGKYPRKSNLNFNTNLLNIRIALNRKSSIALGANIRGYANLNTSTYNFIDTLHNTVDFFKNNRDLTNGNGKVLNSSWIEGYISYARTIADNDFGRLNAGLTVRISRGLSGGYLNIEDVRFSQTVQNNNPVTAITSANIIYGYSANYDHWRNGGTTSQNLNNFMAFTEGGASIDAGIEYLIKPQGTTSFNDEADYYDYDWKLGLSLLDIGGNQYKYGTQSRIIAGVKTNIADASLDKKFDSTVNSFKRFNDSLATLVNIGTPGGKFTVINPTRLVANVDHYLTGDFYINAELSINIPFASLNKAWLQVKEINLLTVTPRWETKKLGFYLPMQYNTQNQFWVGMAFKAGPLLLGINNVANLFGKTTTQNGGGYIALIFRASKDVEGKSDKRLNCPKSIW